MAGQQATGFCDDWFRGVNYQRELVLEDANGTAVDLSTWPNLTMAVEVTTPERVVLRPDATTYAVRYDVARGGAASGAITVFITSAALETGWPDDQDFNVVTWSVKATQSSVVDRPVFNCTLTVNDTAFQ